MHTRSDRDGTILQSPELRMGRGDPRVGAGKVRSCRVTSFYKISESDWIWSSFSNYNLFWGLFRQFPQVGLERVGKEYFLLTTGWVGLGQVKFSARRIGSDQEKWTNAQHCTI